MRLRAVKVWMSHVLFIEPDLDQVLAGEVNWSEIPALHLLVVDDDALIAQQRDVVSHRQGMPLERVDDLQPLLRVDDL